MKKLFNILVLVILGNSNLFGQAVADTIIFVWKNNNVNIRDNKKLNNISFPIRFVFEKEFNGKSITFLSNDSNNIIALRGRQFGDSKIQPTSDFTFQIIIDGSGKIIGQDDSVKVE
ncbi:MAG: hypothetical protein IPO63_12760, partial [Bacteroidetes bacterium]|nr:hypothetical protein [Bacteroidota bacterium]